MFHSFEDFNVARGTKGVFSSILLEFENISSLALLGGNISNILGTLGVLGNANLFLINPNGIFFGLMRDWIWGSFFGSTADSFVVG